MPTVEFHALNVSARPHPPGIYRRLFEALANKRVSYYGEKIAAISKPSDSKDGIFYGLIISWTEIDRNQPIIDTILLDKPDQEKLNELNIPDNLGFNAQIFYYAFRERDHVLVFESRNSENARLGPMSAERLFRGIFSAESVSEVAVDGVKPHIVEVDLLIQRDALDKIFGIESLRSLEISISVPNADDETDSADEIIDRLKRIRAGRQVTTYRAESSKNGLKPDQAIKNQSEAALQGHGYVQGEGYVGSAKVSLNSKSYPQKESAYIRADASSVDTTIFMAQEKFARSTESKTG